MEPLLPKAASKEAEQLSSGGGLWHSPLPKAGGLADRPLQPRTRDRGEGAISFS